MNAKLSIKEYFIRSYIESNTVKNDIYNYLIDVAEDNKFAKLGRR